MLNYTAGGQTTSSIKLKSTLLHSTGATSLQRDALPLQQRSVLQVEPESSSLPPLAAPCRGTALLSPTSGSFPAPLRTFPAALRSRRAALTEPGATPAGVGSRRGWHGPSPGQEVFPFLRLSLAVASCRWELRCQHGNWGLRATQRLPTKTTRSTALPGLGHRTRLPGTCRMAALGEGTAFR